MQQGQAGQEAGANEINPNAPGAPARAGAMPKKIGPEHYQGFTFMQRHGGLVKGVGALIIIAIIAIVAYSVVSTPPPPPVTTVQGVPTFYVSSCEAITTGGDYYLSGDISAPSNNGTCLDIESPNVHLVGRNYQLLGRGPYLANGPYSYGIMIGADSNVSVSQITVLRFAYGIYLNNTDGDSVSNVTVSNSTISGIYLYRSSDNLLATDHVTTSAGQIGSISINYGQNNTIDTSSSEYNSYYGLSLSNSTSNKIVNSILLGNPSDLFCSGNSTYNSSNKFTASTCYMNNFCNFAYCSESNNQSLVTSIALRDNVATCGSINSGGDYALSSNLDMRKFMNLSISDSNGVPCILVNASNVNLNCNGHTISNASYGILTVPGAFNTTVSDCNLQHDSDGIYLNGAIKFLVTNVNADNGNYGISLYNSTGGNLTAVSAHGNNFGVYINATTYAGVSNFNVTGNGYGITMDNSSSVSLSDGQLGSSSKVDLYCSPNAYNSTLLSISATTCKSTDCKWASQSCPVYYLPTLSQYPVNGCTTINTPGSYKLENPVVAKSTCIQIDAANVTFDCNNESVSSYGNSGSAFSVTNAAGVSIYGCRISGFNNGLDATHANNLSFSSTVIRSGIGGVNLSDSSGVVLYNDSVFGDSTYGFWVRSTNNSVMSFNHAVLSSSGYGYSFNRSSDNKIFNNTANATEYGFSFTSTSRNNDVYNNSVFSGNGYDYYCSPDSGYVTDNQHGVNIGITKSNCQWLAEVSGVYLSQSCTLIDSPDTITLSQDMVYGYGGTCFNVDSLGMNTTASGTTINCNGHTVLATDGGTFLQSANASSITLENCILIGFSNPVVFMPSKIETQRVSIINNTFYDTKNTSVYINYAQDSQILGNIFINSSTGIYVYKFNASQINNNNVQRTRIGVLVNGSSTTTLTNDTVNQSSFGIVLSNSTQLSLKQNVITNSLNGLYCSGTSAGNTSNVDLGGNVCKGSSSCGWVTSPSC